MTVLTDEELCAARDTGPHRLDCPAWSPDPDGINGCECTPVTVPAGLGRRVYTGATLLEVHEVLEDYIRVLTADDGPVLVHRREEVRKALSGFADAFHNQILDPEPPGHRDPCTVLEIRQDAGLCPDGGDHFADRCFGHECPTDREVRAADHYAERGVWR